MSAMEFTVNATYSGGAHPSIPNLNYLYAVATVDGNYQCSLAGFVTPEVSALVLAAPDLLDGCNALLGLLQLIENRCDAELLEIIRSNHRVGEAKAAIAKATGEQS